MMGGLFDGSLVKRDLWMFKISGQSISCSSVATVFKGPGARVGHAGLLFGNAFIVFGGDTKIDGQEDLDNILYLLNTCKDLSLMCKSKLLIFASLPALVKSSTF